MVWGPPNEVNFSGCDPSLLHTQISIDPDLLEVKAIFLPFGE